MPNSHKLEPRIHSVIKHQTLHGTIIRRPKITVFSISFYFFHFMVLTPSYSFSLSLLSCPDFEGKEKDRDKRDSEKGVF